MSENLKYSKLKMMKLWVNAKIETYDKIFRKGCFVMLKTTKSISLFLRITLSRGNLMKAINRVAAAFVPPEFEKISILNPNKKQKNKTGILSFLKG